MTDLVPAPDPLPVQLSELQDEAATYARNSRAASTLRAYRSDWTQFTAWCVDHDLGSLPAHPDTVAMYLADAARSLKTSTIRRRLTSIAVVHATAGHDNPTDNAIVRSTWAGIRRAHGTAQQGKDALRTEDIRTMIAALPDNLIGRRDAAILLLGFASGMRRSELVGLDTDDVTDTVEGMVVTIRRSKTDQEGEGRQVGIPAGAAPGTCPVRALRIWMEVSGIYAGPLFRPVDRHGRMSAARLSDRAIAIVVKRAAEQAGLDPARVAGHSLRSGMATAAARAGATEAEIMRQTGHRSLPVLRRYIRAGSLFTDNAAGKLGL